MNTPEESESKNRYIKTDNDTILNEHCIKWVKKRNECLEVCMKGNGCFVGDTHSICETKSKKSYDKLNKHFE